MRKQLTLKKLTLFVLSSILCLLLAIAGITLGSSTQAFAEPLGDPTEAPVNPSGHDAESHMVEVTHVIYPATCVEPGLGVAYCKDCECNVSVVIPADGKSHRVPEFYPVATSEKNDAGICEICGEETGGYNGETKGEGKEQYVEVSGIEDSGMTSLTIPDGIEIKNEEGETKRVPVRVAEGAFEGNEHLQSVEIQGAAEVGDNAFKGCENLTTLTIKDGTKTIGASAFENCKKIADVKLPSSVVSIGEDAFTGTTFAQTKLSADSDNTGFNLLTVDSVDAEGTTEGKFLLKVVDSSATAPAAPARGRRNAPSDSITSYTVANDIKVIADGALKNLSSLTSVTLPAKLKTVGAGAFGGCSSLENVFITDGVVNDDGSYANLSGLGDLLRELKQVKIYYWGTGTVDAEGVPRAPHALSAFTVYLYSENEPTVRGDGYYWHWDEEESAPVIWHMLREVAPLTIDEDAVKKDFHMGEEFSTEGLKVTAHYIEPDGQASDVELKEGYTVDNGGFDSHEVTTEPFTVTVTYLYATVTYEVNVKKACIVTVKESYSDLDKEYSVLDGHQYVLPQVSHRTGYTFLGWQVEGMEGFQQPGTSITVTTNITVTAQWKLLKPTVEFNYGTGVTITNEEEISYEVSALTDNQYTVTVSGKPHRVGYTFSGWKYILTSRLKAEEAASMENDFVLDLADDMAYTVIAQWTVIELNPNLVIDYAGKTAAANGAQAVAKFSEEAQNYTVTVSGKPTLTGYKFTGWAVTGGTPTELGVEGGDITVTLADEMTVTVTARWEQLYTVTVSAPETATVKVTGDNYSEVADVKYYESGKQITFTVKVDNGYKLAQNGVQVEGATLTENYTFTIGEANIIITVETTPVAVNATFTENYGVVETIDRTTNPAQAVISVPVPQKAGYTFDNWTVSYGETETTLKSGEKLTIDLTNSDVTVTFTANWTPIDYHFNMTLTGVTVTYVGEGDPTTSTHHIGDVIKFRVEANNGYHSEVTVSAEGCDQPTLAEGVYSVTFGAGDVTVTASTTPVKLTYKVTGERATDTDVTTEWKAGDAQATFTLKTDLTRTGFAFAGWKITVGADGVATPVEGSEYTLPLAHEDVTVTFEAVWTQLYTVTVNVDANCSYVVTGEAASTVDGTKYYAENTVVTITLTVNNGFKLASVKNGETDDLGTSGTYSVTVGTQNVTITVTTVKVDVTVKYAEDGYGVSPTLDRTNPAQAKITNFRGTPHKVGYTFTKWTYKIGENGQETDYVDPLVIDLKNEDVIVIFKAIFTRLEPVVTFELGGSESNVTTSCTFDEGTNSYTVKIDGKPELTNYRFNGWKLTGAVAKDLSANETTFDIQLADNMNVTLTAKWLKLYTLNVEGVENATVAYSGSYNTLQDEYAEGETVTLTIAPNANYVLDGIKVTGAPDSVTAEGGSVTLTFGEGYEDTVTVTATLTQIFEVRLDSSSYTGATVTLQPAEGPYRADTEITLTIEVQDGYKLKSVEFNTNNSKLDEFTGQNSYTFTPTENLTITIKVVAIYSVTYAVEDDATGVSGLPANQQNIELTDFKSPLSTTPTKTEEGKQYTFLYWYYKSGEQEVEVDDSFDLAAAAGESHALTIYAKFVETHTATLSIKEYATAHGWQSGNNYGQGTDENPKVEIDNNISVTAKKTTGSNNNTGKYNVNTNKGTYDWRIYQNENPELTFSTDNDAIIVTVKITYAVDHTGILTSADKGSQYESDALIYVNKSTVTFTVGNTGAVTNGNIQITAIEVVYYGGKIITDQDRVDEAIKTLSETMEVTAKGDVELSAGTGDIEFNWTTNDETYTVIGAKGAQKLHVEKLPTDKDATVILTVEATLNEAKASKTVTVTIKHKDLATGDVVFDFSAWSGTGTGITDTEALATFKELLSEDNKGLLTSVSKLSYVYDGNTSDGSRGAASGLLKLGKSRNEGAITLTFSKQVSVVTIVCQNWDTDKTNTITVNDLATQTPSDTASELLTFVLTEKVTSITITTSERIFVDSIGVTFYVPTPEDLVSDALATVGNIDVSTTGKVALTQNVGEVTISWELKNTEELTGYGTFEGGELNITTLPDTDVKLQFEVKATLEGANAQTKEVTVTLKAEKEGFNPLTSPVEGTYKLAMDVNGVYYYAQSSLVSSYYIQTTTDVSLASDYTLKQQGSGWVIMQGTNYLEIAFSGSTYANPKFNATQTSDKTWTWDSEKGVFVWIDGSQSAFLGNYGSKTDIGGVMLSYFDDDYHTYLGIYKEHVMTAEEKIAAAKAEIENKHIDLEESYSEVKDNILLPNENSGANISWAIQNDADVAEFVKIETSEEDGRQYLKISKLPTEGDLTITLVATISCDPATSTDEANFTITLKPAGSTEPGGGEEEPKEITEYNLVKSLDELKDKNGYAVVFVYQKVVSGKLGDNKLAAVTNATFDSDSKITNLGDAEGCYWTLVKVSDTVWQFKNQAGFLAHSSGNLNTTATNDNKWEISFDSTNNATVKCAANSASDTSDTYEIRYNDNAGATMFKAYKGTVKAIKLFVSNAPVTTGGG